MRIIVGIWLFLQSVIAAHADVLPMSIKSHHPNIVSLVFYSQNLERSWPGKSKVYTLDESKTNRYVLECRGGEKICFGAWVQTQPEKYWGVGKGNAHHCSDCCYVCGQDGSSVRHLHP
ncbi:MAG: hypothetical protein ACI92Z_003690 [Paracoccaceae bacterium]|jgi:hypothetical protein